MTVVNHAVGGAFASDLMPQAAGVGLTADDRVAVSVGTNDAAPWKRVDLSTVLTHAGEFLAAYAGTVDRLVLVTSPGVDETRLQAVGDRTNLELLRYASALREVFVGVGAAVVDAASVLAPLGAAAFTEDGVHLTGAGYDGLLPAVRAALARPAIGHSTGSPLLVVSFAVMW